MIRTFPCRYQSESNSSVAVVLRPNRILSSRPQAVRTSRMRSGCCWTLVRLTSNRNENSRTQSDVFGLRSQLQLLTDVAWNQQYTPELQHSPAQHTFVDTRAVQPVATCRQSPTSISQLLSLWRHSHHDVSPTALAAPVSTMTSFSLWRHSLLNWPRLPLRTYITDTLPRLIYIKMSKSSNLLTNLQSAAWSSRGLRVTHVNTVDIWIALNYCGK